MPRVRIFSKAKEDIFYPFDQPSKTDASYHGVFGNGVKARKFDSLQRSGASEDF